MATSKPLRIVVDADWQDHPAIVELRESGHEIVLAPEDVDLFLSRRAHAWTDSYWSLKISLLAVLKWARARRYPPKPAVPSSASTAPRSSRKTRPSKGKTTPPEPTSS